MTINNEERIKSFVARKGRLTKSQAVGLNQLDRFSFHADHIDLENKSVYLEVGFGMGDGLIEMAKLFPDILFIGAEVYPCGVGHLIGRCIKENISNILIFHDDVYKLLPQLHPSSLSQIQIFFPDPWHKRKHQKRRLINESFLDHLIPLLISGGRVHIVTDWADYDKSLNTLFKSVNSLKRISYSRPFYRSKTKYEKRGLGLGHKIFEHIYVKI